LGLNVVFCGGAPILETSRLWHHLQIQPNGLSSSLPLAKREPQKGKDSIRRSQYDSSANCLCLTKARKKTICWGYVCGASATCLLAGSSSSSLGLSVNIINPFTDLALPKDSGVAVGGRSNSNNNSIPTTAATTTAFPSLSSPPLRVCLEFMVCVCVWGVGVWVVVLLLLGVNWWMVRFRSSSGGRVWVYFTQSVYGIARSSSLASASMLHLPLSPWGAVALLLSVGVGVRFVVLLLLLWVGGGLVVGVRSSSGGGVRVLFTQSVYGIARSFSSTSASILHQLHILPIFRSSSSSACVVVAVVLVVRSRVIFTQPVYGLARSSSLTSAFSLQQPLFSSCFFHVSVSVCVVPLIV